MRRKISMIKKLVQFNWITLSFRRKWLSFAIDKNANKAVVFVQCKKKMFISNDLKAGNLLWNEKKSDKIQLEFYVPLDSAANATQHSSTVDNCISWLVKRILSVNAFCYNVQAHTNRLIPIKMWWNEKQRKNLSFSRGFFGVFFFFLVCIKSFTSCKCNILWWKQKPEKLHIKASCSAIFYEDATFCPTFWFDF